MPTLHAISALGTKLCFYSLSTVDRNAGIVPRYIARHPDMANDTAPQSRWDCDLLEEEGEGRFMAVVNEIIAACEAIGEGQAAAVGGGEAANNQ